MYIVLGTIKVKPAHLDEFIEHVRRHAANSLREPGCLRYEVLQEREDPTTICLYEVFRTKADLDVHQAKDYYAEWMTRSRNWRERSGSSRRVLERIV